MSGKGARPATHTVDDLPTSLARLRSAWLAEKRASADEQRHRRLSLTLKERVAAGDALSDLKVVDEDPGGYDRTVVWVESGRDSMARFRGSPGEPVLIWRAQPDEEGAIRGQITRRRADRLGLLIGSDDAESLETPGFRLDLLENEITFARGERAIAQFERAESVVLRKMAACLFLQSAPVWNRADGPRFFDDALNLPQQEAITFLLQHQPVACLHGPPGTGKTRTLVEVVRQLIANGGKVLVSAPSNAAVDNLCERLLWAGVPVVRLGNPARVSATVEQCTLQARIEQTPTWELTREWLRRARSIRRDIRNRSERGTLTRDQRMELQSEASRLFRDAREQTANIERATLESAQVVACTAGGVDSALLSKLEFAAAVVDEATQCSDPLLLAVALHAPRLILAGDPCQLPPTVLSTSRDVEPLRSTFLERLMQRWEDAVVRMLTIQHRMHPDIMEFPSSAMYGGQLVADACTLRHLVQQGEWLVDEPRAASLLFIDTAGKGWDEVSDGGSWCNPAAGERVLDEYRRLISRGVSPSDIAILVPYRAQKLWLDNRLLQRELAPVEVSTIDGFQGREAEFILLDLVRSNSEGQVGFLSDSRRMNVAMTRARRGLIVVGDSATIGGSPFFRDFLDAVPVVGRWMSAWDDDAEPLEPAV